MSDYGRVFGEEVAQGLGLGQPPVVEETVESYEADPAAAFSRMAELMQPPGKTIPVPFATVVSFTENPQPHAREPRPA